MSSKIPSDSGHTTQMGHPCAMASIHWPGNASCSISLITTLGIQGGLRGWNILSVSAGFGPRLASLPSALAPSTPNPLMDRPAVAATMSFTLSWILYCRNHSSRSLSNHVGICAIFIQNIIANWTLLSSIGVLQNFGSMSPAAQGPFARWKRKCWIVLMTSPWNKFKGALPTSFFILELSKLFCRFANRSARFISASSAKRQTSWRSLMSLETP